MAKIKILFEPNSNGVDVDADIGIREIRMSRTQVAGDVSTAIDVIIEPDGPAIVDNRPGQPKPAMVDPNEPVRVQ